MVNNFNILVNIHKNNVHFEIIITYFLKKILYIFLFSLLSIKILNLLINQLALVVNFKFFQVYLPQSRQILPKSFYLGSILRLVKIIQSKLPKKVKRDPIEHVNPRFGQLPNNKIIEFLVVKKTQIEFLGSVS